MPSWPSWQHWYDIAMRWHPRCPACKGKLNQEILGPSCNGYCRNEDCIKYVPWGTRQRKDHDAE